jgi:hypothetical protein
MKTGELNPQQFDETTWTIEKYLQSIGGCLQMLWTLWIFTLTSHLSILKDWQKQTSLNRWDICATRALTNFPSCRPCLEVGNQWRIGGGYEEKNSGPLKQATVSGASCFCLGACHVAVRGSASFSFTLKRHSVEDPYLNEGHSTRPPGNSDAGYIPPGLPLGGILLGDRDCFQHLSRTCSLQRCHIPRGPGTYDPIPHCPHSPPRCNLGANVAIPVSGELSKRTELEIWFSKNNKKRDTNVEIYVQINSWNTFALAGHVYKHTAYVIYLINVVSN